VKKWLVLPAERKQKVFPVNSFGTNDLILLLVVIVYLLSSNEGVLSVILIDVLHTACLKSRNAMTTYSVS